MANSPLLPQTVDGNLIIALDSTRLVAARKDKDVTQAQLAAAIGVTKGYISQLERGVRKPSLQTVRDICGRLAVDLTDVCVHVPVPGGDAA